MPTQSPFNELHVSLGATMACTGDWMTAAVFRTVADEVAQTHRSGSLFDASGMGRLFVSGPDAAKLVDQACAARVADLPVNEYRQGLVFTDAGDPVDIVTVVRESKSWMIIGGWGKGPVLLRHLQGVRRKLDLDCDIADQTLATAMVHIQGPRVVDRLNSALPVNIEDIRPGHILSANLLLIRVQILRISVTGEDGVAIILPAKMAPMAIKMLSGKGDRPDATIRAAGTQAMAVLRIEAGLPAVGHEVPPAKPSLPEALASLADANKDYIGAAAVRQNTMASPKQLVGLAIMGDVAPAEGSALSQGGKVVGTVTSATVSPTLGKPIAMALVDVGTRLDQDMEIAGSTGAIACRCTPLPFVARSTAQTA